MPQYVTNTQISMALKTKLKSDVDLGGVQFSYEHGLFYDATEPPLIVRMPIPFTPGLAKPPQQFGLGS